jgi:hypothetical protein
MAPGRARCLQATLSQLFGPRWFQIGNVGNYSLSNITFCLVSRPTTTPSPGLRADQGRHLEVIVVSKRFRHVCCGNGDSESASMSTTQVLHLVGSRTIILRTYQHHQAGQGRPYLEYLPAPHMGSKRQMAITFSYQE